MPASLEGRIAVVTGVSRQGRLMKPSREPWQKMALRLRFAHARRGNVEARPADLRQAGARVLAVAASLTEESGAKQLTEAAIKEREGRPPPYDQRANAPQDL